jgi:hypothetical protein
MLWILLNYLVDEQFVVLTTDDAMETTDLKKIRP